MQSLVDSSKLSTFKIGGLVKELIVIKNKKDIPNLPKKCLVIGSGSNIIFSDKVQDISIAKMEIKGIEILKKENDKVKIRIGAGEKWDSFVNFCVKNNFSGVEALSAIPGTVGASPIQNIGAYGAEVKDVIQSIEAYDTKEKKWILFSNKDCEFSYRDSIFKRNPNRWIVSYIIFKLYKNKPIVIPDYKDVKKYFEDRKNIKINLTNIRKAIIEIRKNKLPDPKLIPNCGSFFKNPIISKIEAEKLKEMLPFIPIFPFGRKFKISAGFLIEKAGFKGKEINNIIVHENNALVLTNPNNASFDDLLRAKNKIQKTILKKFGVILEPEVNIIK